MAAPSRLEGRMQGVPAEVIAIIARKLPDKGDRINLSDNLRDLGLESIDALEMVFDLEEKFGIEISDDQIAGVKTVGEAADLVISKQTAVG